MSNLEFTNTPPYLLSLTDRELASELFYVDAAIIEGEAFACDPEDYDRFPYEPRDLIKREIDNRLRLGLDISVPEDHVEYQLAPWGPEWEREQEDRLVGA